MVQWTFSHSAYINTPEYAECLWARLFDKTMTKQLRWMETLKINKIIKIAIGCNHSVNSSSHSVNGDIAFQWEWSNFDPSQNSNPITDCDKTLHNILCPQDEQETQNLCQSVVRERLAKYMKHNTKIYFLLFFFSGLPTEVTRERILTHSGSKHAESSKHVPNGIMALYKFRIIMIIFLGVWTMTDNIYGFKFPKNHQN